MFKTKLGNRLFPILVILLFFAGCSPEARPLNNRDNRSLTVNGTEKLNDAAAAEATILPAVEVEDGKLSGLIHRRRSHRSYGERALELSEIGKILWAAGGLSIDGVTGPTRTYPSAGGTYPLDIYLAAGDIVGLAAGVYRYDHEGHTLVPVASGDVRERLSEAALNQGFIATAPASIILVAHFERTRTRYGERGERYVHMDTGYASQNIYLAATDMGLGTAAIGAFNDSALAATLQTDGDPLMIMPLGETGP